MVIPAVKVVLAVVVVMGIIIATMKTTILRVLLLMTLRISMKNSSLRLKL